MNSFFTTYIRMIESSRYAWRLRKWQQDRRRKNVRRLCEIMLQRTNNTVYSGPFAEMKLIKGSFLALQPPMILGSYESEIYHSLYRVICIAPRRIIDIGSAHGYYTVGLARQLPDSTIIAFEGDEGHWNEAKRLAVENSVEDRIIQRGFCTVEELSTFCEPHSFILCDCEGGEINLLNPQAIPNMTSCYIVCELHDFLHDGITGELIRRFKKTHIITIHCEMGRDPINYRLLHRLPKNLQRLAVEETRYTEKKITVGRFMELIPKPESSSFWNQEGSRDFHS